MMNIYIYNMIQYNLGIGSIINLAHLFRSFIQVIYQLTGAL